MKHQSAPRCGRVDPFLNTPESHLAAFQTLNDLDQMFQGPAQAVEAPNNQAIPLAGKFKRLCKAQDAWSEKIFLQPVLCPINDCKTS
jgi:hypothetical protein